MLFMCSTLHALPQPTGVLQPIAQLAEDSPSKHGAQKDVEDVPEEEEGGDAAVQGAQGDVLPLTLKAQGGKESVHRFSLHAVCTVSQRTAGTKQARSRG